MNAHETHLIQRIYTEVPILSEIPKQADKNYILENLDVNLPIKLLSTHIREDIFWKRCFRNRWRNCFPENTNKRWISSYMEKDLAEMLENLEPCNYDQEEMQRILEIAAPYIEELNISCLQPSMDDKTGELEINLNNGKVEGSETVSQKVSTRKHSSFCLFQI